MTGSILYVDGFKGPLMLLPALDDSNSASVPSPSHHDNIPNIKLDEINNLVAF